MGEGRLWLARDRLHVSSWAPAQRYMLLSQGLSVLPDNRRETAWETAVGGVCRSNTIHMRARARGMAHPDPRAAEGPTPHWQHARN